MLSSYAVGWHVKGTRSISLHLGPSQRDIQTVFRSGRQILQDDLRFTKLPARESFLSGRR